MRAGREARPVDGLFRFFGWDAERDAAIEGDKFDLDIEAVAVLVRPSCTDASPDGFAAFAVADVVNDVAGRVGRGGLVVVGISHGKVSFLSSSGCANRGLMVREKKSLGAGAKRNAQAKNWGRPSGGTDFLLARPGWDFKPSHQKGRVVQLKKHLKGNA